MNILTIILFSICVLFNTSTGSQNQKGPGTITLQSEVKNPDASSLKKAADIISSRLNMYGIKSFSIKTNSPEQIKIEMNENFDHEVIEGLLTSKGEIVLYETLTQSEIQELFQNNKEIFTKLNRKADAKPADPRIGCTEDRSKVEENLLPASGKYKFLWGNESSEDGFCLFALKLTAGGPLLRGSDIESAKFTGSGDDYRIHVNLKPSAVGVFADATKNNLNRSIAIVIDEKVYSWPVVRSAIEGGQVEVTGNFSENEIKYFPVIFTSGQLPFNMKMVK